MARRAALYARVSTAGQDPAGQIEALRAAAAARGVEVVGEHVDHGVSGARASRPALDAMLATVRAGGVDVVMVAALDRLGRNLLDLLRLAEELRARGVELVSLREGVDLHSPVGRALFSMLGIVGELEREWIRERVTAGVRRAKTSPRPGKKRPGRPRNVDAARVAEAARARVAAGEALAGVARALGVPRNTLRRALGR